MITSLQNSKLKLVRALQGRSRERYTEQAFVAEGVRLIEEAVAADWRFRFVLFDETLSERGHILVEQLRAKQIEVEDVSSHLMRSLSDTESPQGILAVLDFDQKPLQSEVTFALIADQIRDPGNLGTLLRSAAAARVEVVFIPPDTTDPFSPKVVRAGMGAHFRVAIQQATWDEIQAQTRHLTLFAADVNAGLSFWQADFRAPLALIVGGEAEGASHRALAASGVSVSIPMPGAMESLNAGVAGSLLIFEVVRQRQ